MNLNRSPKPKPARDGVCRQRIRIFPASDLALRSALSRLEKATFGRSLSDLLPHSGDRRLAFLPTARCLRLRSRTGLFRAHGPSLDRRISGLAIRTSNGGEQNLARLADSGQLMFLIRLTRKERFGSRF